MTGVKAIKDHIPNGSRLFCADGLATRGGVAVWVHQRIARSVDFLGVSRIPRGMESVWLRIKADILALGGHTLLIGAIYTAPLGSRMYVDENGHNTGRTNERVFARLKALIQRHRGSLDAVLIAGDMNARTADICDLPDVEGDIDLEEHMGIPIGESVAMRGIPQRKCKDVISNTFVWSYPDRALP
ncbi:hypothetical protein Vafri_6786 [Volvox africanus]|uniref:Endonuclease/exonuclease/phosphatase domain-containing protein n=1 Tax=Volvox africanus TaxID=51714 RepID=A0A8J4AZX2_9CHLO|nr:hypothetical protein Vafri_6786 [Volvox africanus]